MKKFNKKYELLVSGWVLLVALIFIGAKIGGNVTRFGDKTGVDISLQLGNGRLNWDDTAQQLKFSNDAGGSEKAIGSGGGAGGGLNLLLDNNFDFESGDPPSAWVSSGGTFVAETVNPLNGGQSGLWDPSVSAQNLDSPLKTVPITLEGNSCLARIFYKWETGSAGDIKLQALDSSSAILNQIDLVPTTGQVKEAFVTFTCPTADTIRLRLTSTTNANVITVDDAHLGSNIKEIQVASSEIAFAGGYAATANCIWIRTNTANGAFGVDADCPGISTDITASGVVVDSSDDDLPTLKFTSLPPGNYKLIWRINTVVVTAATNATFLIRDVTNSVDLDSVGYSSTTANQNQPATLIATFTQTVAGAHDFEIFGSSSAGAINLSAQSSTQFLAKNSIVLTRFPLASETALSFNLANWHIDANIGGANPSLGASDQTTYIPIVDAGGGLDMVLRTGSHAAEIGCSGGNAPTGLTCGAGNEGVSVAFAPPEAGKFEVCFDLSHFVTLGASGVIAATFQAIETTLTSDVVGQLGGTRKLSEPADSNISATNPLYVCGGFTFNNVEKKLIRLMYEQSATATVTTNILLADRDADTGQRDIRVTVRRWSERRGGISFDNLTESANKAGAKDIAYSITWQGSGVPIVEFDSGNVIDSIVDVGTGDVTINYVSGTAVNPIVCLCVPRDDSPLFCNPITRPPTNTATRFRIYNPSGTLTDPDGADEGIDVRCSEQK